MSKDNRLRIVKGKLVPPRSDEGNFGGVSRIRNKDYAWIVFQDSLLVYELIHGTSPQTQTHKLKAKFLFTNDLVGWERSKLEIACVTEATIDGEQYLVACIIGEKESQLRVLDILHSKTSLVIELPFQVSEITYVPKNSYLEHLKFRDILAVGTKGGRVLLLDLFPFDNDGNTTTAHVVELEDYDFDAFHAEHENARPYIQLNEKFLQRGSIALFSAGDNKDHYGALFPTSEDLNVIASKQVQVTAISYIPQIRAFVVGFNVGCFQLFSAKTLELVYSSPNDNTPQAGRQAPVTHFQYQQLPDDNYGYLWVARGSIRSSTKTHRATIQVHSLQFGVNDVMTDEVNNNVDMLEMVYLKKRVEATSIHGSPASAGRVVYCSLLSDANLSKERYTSGDALEVKQNRVVFVWEVFSRDATTHNELRMEIIDIAPILKTIDHSSTTEFDFDETIVQSIPLSTLKTPSSCLSVYIDQRSVLDFSTSRISLLGRSENPAPDVAPSFDGIFLFQDSLWEFSYLNTQEKAVREITIASLHQPNILAKAFKNCEGARLVEVSARQLNPLEESDYQRDCLLSLALQHDMLRSICGYIITRTNDPDVPFLLANPAPVMRWAWGVFTNLKSTLDRHYNDRSRSLFAEHQLESTERARILCDLDEVFVRLADLYHVFEVFRQREEGISDDGLRSLSTKQEEILTIAQRLEAVLWFVQNELLPPANSKRELFSSLGESYSARRIDRASRYTSNSWKVENMIGVQYEDAAGTSGELFVDLLAKSIGVYPPASFKDLLLLEFTPSQILEIRCLVLYFLYDLVQVGILTSDSAKQVIESFARMAALSVAQQKLVRGFWLLDSLGDSELDPATLHGRMEDACDLFLQVQDIEDWPSKILRTFVDYGGFAQALRFSRAHYATAGAPARGLVLEDCAVCVIGFLENGNLYEGLALAREFLAGSKPDQYTVSLQTLLFHILRICEKKNMLSTLFLLPFNELEDQCLQHYLVLQAREKELGTNAVPPLLLYLLRRGRITEALAAYEQLKQDNKHRMDIDGNELLHNLMEGYRSLLPPSQANVQPAGYPHMEFLPSERLPATQQSLPSTATSFLLSGLTSQQQPSKPQTQQTQPSQRTASQAPSSSQPQLFLRSPFTKRTAPLFAASSAFSAPNLPQPASATRKMTFENTPIAKPTPTRPTSQENGRLVTQQQVAPPTRTTVPTTQLTTINSNSNANANTNTTTTTTTLGYTPSLSKSNFPQGPSLFDSPLPDFSKTLFGSYSQPTAPTTTTTTTTSSLASGSSATTTTNSLRSSSSSIATPAAPLQSSLRNNSAATTTTSTSSLRSSSSGLNTASNPPPSASAKRRSVAFVDEIEEEESPDAMDFEPTKPTSSHVPTPAKPPASVVEVISSDEEEDEEEGDEGDDEGEKGELEEEELRKDEGGKSPSVMRGYPHEYEPQYSPGDAVGLQGESDSEDDEVIVKRPLKVVSSPEDEEEEEEEGEDDRTKHIEEIEEDEDEEEDEEDIRDKDTRRSVRREKEESEEEGEEDKEEEDEEEEGDEDGDEEEGGEEEERVEEDIIPVGRDIYMKDARQPDTIDLLESDEEEESESISEEEAEELQEEEDEEDEEAENKKSQAAQGKRHREEEASADSEDEERSHTEESEEEEEKIERTSPHRTLEQEADEKEKEEERRKEIIDEEDEEEEEEEEKAVEQNKEEAVDTTKIGYFGDAVQIDENLESPGKSGEPEVENEPQRDEVSEEEVEEVKELNNAVTEAENVEEPPDEKLSPDITGEELDSSPKPTIELELPEITGEEAKGLDDSSPILLGEEYGESLDKRHSADVDTESDGEPIQLEEQAPRPAINNKSQYDGEESDEDVEEMAVEPSKDTSTQQPQEVVAEENVNNTNNVVENNTFNGVDNNMESEGEQDAGEKNKESEEEEDVKNEVEEKPAEENTHNNIAAKPVEEEEEDEEETVSPPGTPPRASVPSPVPARPSTRSRKSKEVAKIKVHQQLSTPVLRRSTRRLTELNSNNNNNNNSSNDDEINLVSFKSPHGSVLLHALSIPLSDSMITLEKAQSLSLQRRLPRRLMRPMLHSCRVHEQHFDICEISPAPPQRSTRKSTRQTDTTKKTTTRSKKK